MSELLNFLLTHEEQFRRARLPSLYSDFRLQQATNPDGYQANLSAWETGLIHAAQAGLIPGGKDMLILRTGEPLLRALETREWGRPLALTPVFAASVLSGHMIPLEEYLTSHSSIYERNWSITPWTVVSWMLKQLGLTGGLSSRAVVTAGQYVLVKNIEEAAGKVMASMGKRTSRVDRIVPISAFSEKVGNALGLTSRMTNEDLNILLVHLSRDQKHLIYDEQVVKLKGEGTGSSEITVDDINIASLKSLVVGLNVQLEELTRKISKYDNKARLALANQNRVIAMSSLRSKRLYGSILGRRYETLAQLEEVLTKIEDAADHIEVVRVMQASTKVLRGLDLEIGGMETVENVLEELKTEMNQVEAVSAIINETAQANNFVDESVINEELEALEEQDQAREDEQDPLDIQKRLGLLDKVEHTIPDNIVTNQDQLSNSTRVVKPLYAKDERRKKDGNEQFKEATRQREVRITS